MTTAGYSVERTPHGILVHGPVPLDDVTALMKTWQQRGLDILDAGIAMATGANLAVTSEEGSRAWRAEIAKKAALVANGDPELEWLHGTDTGVSSLTIFSVLSRRYGTRALVRIHRGAVGAPHDPSDLGRCIRLLDAIPGWRERLPEVAASHPEWAPLVERWADLERLYRVELTRADGKATKTLELMQEIKRAAAAGGRA